jgi:hypothetical protein
VSLPVELRRLASVWTPADRAWHRDAHARGSPWKLARWFLLAARSADRRDCSTGIVELDAVLGPASARHRLAPRAARAPTRRSPRA